MKKVFLAFTALMFSATLAFAALTLDAAKQQGLVGEQADGLLGAVAASSEASSLVESTNAERLARYKSIAAKNGTETAAVQALAGKKLIDQTPAGEFVRGADGAWRKK